MAQILSQITPYVSQSIPPDPGYDYRYTSLPAWKSGRAGNLITRGVIEIAELFNGNASGVSILQSDGWVADSTHFPWVRAAPGYGHGGQFRIDRAYIYHKNLGYGYSFNTNVGYTRFGPGVVVHVDAGVGQLNSEYLCPQVRSAPAGKPVIFDGIIVKRRSWTDRKSVV